MEDKKEPVDQQPLPLVSVAITTYNLEKLVARSIDSALAQEVPFPIEIVIGDDGSTDGTLQVVASYAERYPNLIRVFTREKNVGIQRNTFETLDRCRGRYTAWLDGDDYWTDPHKLAKQVNILESDSSVSVCGHAVRWVTLEGEIKRDRYPSVAAGRYGMEEILRHNFLATPCVVFRTGAHRSVPSWYFEFESLSDWIFWVMSAQTGDIVLLDDVMADVTSSSTSSFMSRGQLYWYQADLNFYNCLEHFVPAQYRRLVRAEKGKRYEAIAYELRKQGQFSKSREAAWKAFVSPMFSDNVMGKSKSLLAAVVREVQSKLRRSPAAVTR